MEGKRVLVWKIKRELIAAGSHARVEGQEVLVFQDNGGIFSLNMEMLNPNNPKKEYEIEYT